MIAIFSDCSCFGLPDFFKPVEFVVTVLKLQNNRICHCALESVFVIRKLYFFTIWEQEIAAINVSIPEMSCACSLNLTREAIGIIF